MIPFYSPGLEPSGYPKTLLIRPFDTGNSPTSREVSSWAADNNWTTSGNHCIILEFDDVDSTQVHNLLQEPYNSDTGVVTSGIIGEHIIGGHCKWDRIQSQFVPYLAHLSNNGYPVDLIAMNVTGARLNRDWVYDQSGLGTNVISGLDVINNLYQTNEYRNKRLVPALQNISINTEPIDANRGAQQAMVNWNSFVDVKRAEKFTKVVANTAKMYYPNILVSNFGMNYFEGTPILSRVAPLKMPLTSAAVDNTSAPDVRLFDEIGYTANVDALLAIDICIGTNHSGHNTTPWIAGPNWEGSGGSNVTQSQFDTLTGQCDVKNCPFIVII